jgi:O-antigen/teichoic acid export membrane protein
MVTTYFGPIFYRRLSGNADNHSHSKAWQDYGSAVIPSLVLTGFFIIAVAPELVKLLLGPEFQESGKYVVWGALAEVARTATGVYALGAHARMNTRLLIIPNLIGAFIALILVQLFAPIYGLDGVGAALFLSSLSALCASILVNKRHIKVRISYASLIKSLMIGSVFLGIGLLIDFTNILQNEIIISIITVIFFGASFLFAQYYLLKNFLEKN